MKKKEIVAFRKQLRRFEQLITLQLKESTCCNGVSMAQCHWLLMLEELGACSLRTLAENLGLEKSTVSRTVEGLVRTRLVDRETNPQNRRETRLSLTPAGEAVVADINNENNAYFGLVFDAIAPGNREQVLKGFEQLVAGLAKVSNQRRDDDSSCCQTK